MMQPHDVCWVCKFCQVRLKGELRKRLHKTSTSSPCSRNWVKRLKEEVRSRCWNRRRISSRKNSRSSLR